MGIDKDKPSSWIRYKDGMCASCIGTCCTMPVEVRLPDLILLGYASEDDVPRKLKLKGIVRSYREATGLFMLERRPNGDCLFLDANTRLCTVYEKRPQVCRDFPVKMGNRLGHCPKIEKPAPAT